MLEFIEGEIVAKEPQKVVLRAGGIGYGLPASNQTLALLPPVGSKALIFTSIQVREDDISLFGFASKEERSFFELLIQVSGVGAKLALAILSAYSIAALRKAIVLGELAALTGISGVGKKTAQRLVLELKDKLSKYMLPEYESGQGEAAGAAAGDEAMGQAIEALEALGYSRGEVIKVFSGKDVGSLDVEGLIKFGLKQLARF
jgi:Holliday junction DNA helicase RuvA